MNNIRITKVFNFEMAHALKGYDGPCRHIHGHSYQLSVTVIGKPLEDNTSPKLGMVMDFGVLKCIVKDLIVDKFDHALILNKEMQHESSLKTKDLFDKVIYVDYQPTSENMIADFAQKLIEKLPENINLHNLKLRETNNSYAEWFAEDNK